MNFSKYLSVFMILFSALVLMACGEKPSSSKPVSKPPSPPAETPALPVQPPPPPTAQVPDERVPGESAISSERLCLFRRLQAAATCKSKILQGYELSRKKMEFGEFELFKVRISVIENGTFAAEIVKTRWCDFWLFRPNCAQTVSSKIRGIWLYQNDQIRFLNGGKEVLADLDVREAGGKVEAEVAFFDPALLDQGIATPFPLHLEESCAHPTEAASVNQAGFSN